MTSYITVLHLSIWVHTHTHTHVASIGDPICSPSQINAHWRPGYKTFACTDHAVLQESDQPTNDINTALIYYSNLPLLVSCLCLLQIKVVHESSYAALVLHHTHVTLCMMGMGQNASSFPTTSTLAPRHASLCAVSVW